MKTGTPERFWQAVDKSRECWIWTGGNSGNGFGRFYIGGEKWVYAHSAAYEFMVGKVPPGKLVEQTCRNGMCVNPAHMMLVTRKQNSEDRIGANKNSKTGVRGVHWDKGRSMYVAYVKHNRKSVFVGRFPTVEAAEEVVVAKRNQLFTHNELDRTRG